MEVRPIHWQPVALLPFEPEHVSQRYVDWLNDPEVTKFTEVPPGQTIENARAYVAQGATDKNSALWRVTVDGEHVGNIRISNIVWKHLRADVALMIGEKSVWGRGIGTEAIRLVTAYGFDTMKLHRLQAGIYANNGASLRAFEKAGYTVEAKRSDYSLFDGEYVDAYLVAKISH